MTTLAAVGVSEPVAFGYAVLVHLSFYVPITLWGVGITFAYGVSFGEMVARARQARPIDLDARSVRTLRPAGHTDAAPNRATVALCEALLPPEPHDRTVLADVARFVDAEMRDLPGRLAWLYALGMFGFRALTLLRFLRPLHHVALTPRRAWVERFAHGGFAPGRQLFRAARSTALLAFYEHPHTRDAMLPAAPLVTLGKERARGEA
jgi:hypothetical protein